jgi:hypothetical protein
MSLEQGHNKGLDPGNRAKGCACLFYFNQRTVGTAGQGCCLTRDVWSVWLGAYISLLHSLYTMWGEEREKRHFAECLLIFKRLVVLEEFICARHAMLQTRVVCTRDE